MTASTVGAVQGAGVQDSCLGILGDSGLMEQVTFELGRIFDAC